MNCPKCEKKLPKSVKNCPDCGAQIPDGTNEKPLAQVAPSQRKGKPIAFIVCAAVVLMAIVIIYHREATALNKGKRKNRIDNQYLTYFQLTNLY